MLFKEITILNEDFEIAQDMYVGVSGDSIQYIGKTEPTEDFGEVYSGKNRLLMPGFYNAHAHSPMALMRGYGENLALMDWLHTRIFPFEDRLNSNAVYWGTLLCMAESLRYGIVSSSDMYYFIPDMVSAVADSGAKANISRAVANPMGLPIEKLPSMDEARAAIQQYHGVENGRILMDASIHAEYTSNEETVRAVADLAKETGVRMHVHLSETKSEHEECKVRRGGLSPAQYFNRCGIFDVPTIAAHCVWCEDDDFAILKEKGVTVASNPVSNLKLASGICNVTELLRREIPVAIGTDSVASNNNLSFFEEMKTLAILAKVREMNPTVVTPKQVLKAATVNGALAQGREDCGAVRVGNKADLLVLRTDTPNLHPVHHMQNNLVYAASDGDIVLTMVDGKILYQDGAYTTIDIERTIFEAEAATLEILKQL